MSTMTGSTVAPGRMSRLTEASASFNHSALGVVEVGGIREQFLDTRPISFAIPGYSEYHGGTDLFRSLSFHCVLLITAATLAPNPALEPESPPGSIEHRH